VTFIHRCASAVSGETSGEEWEKANLFDPHTSSLSPSSPSFVPIFAVAGAAAWFERGAAVLLGAAASLCMDPTNC
jgi:hypothetical protein